MQEPVLHQVTAAAMDSELEAMAAKDQVDYGSCLKVVPYGYQEEGMRFGLYKKAVLIGDEMGLGKTLQAIGLGVLKKKVFGFGKVLVVTVSSLQEQWQREIERFSDEKGCIIGGSAKQRREQYHQDTSLFKITNYEAVLRDVTTIARFKPDLVILDEAQRIKNFETKTAAAVKSLPRQHAIILTDTPLENKLEDVYSLVQLLDPDLLSPLWQFAADHFLLNRDKKNDILGYTNLSPLHEKLKRLVIRRRKEEVLDELPQVIVNEYFVDLYQEQEEMYGGYAQLLLPLMNKKVLTPMDFQRIMALLLKMRQVCDSTYLIDRQSNISPKLDELANILEELVGQNKRKVVIFSEWTSMTMLIGRHLSWAGIPFVELPWNPAKLNQRIGRVNRIGQTSKCVNVINLIAKKSIEERIMASIQLKQELFNGVFDGGDDEVLLSRQKRQEIVEKLREMIGEEADTLNIESLPAEELAEDTPHFLNPEVLNREVDFVGEEESGPVEELAPAGEEAEHAAEKMEEALNQGLGFISTMPEIATGKKLSVAETSEKMVSVNKETGEVTLKFTLPGFPGASPG